MSRVSSLVLGAFVAILATTAGCKVSVETKTRFTETVKIQDTQEWAGEPIVIDIPGVGIAVNGGIRVDLGNNTIAAEARTLAMAFDDHKADADLSLADVKAGFQITRENGTIFIRCPHGGSHGDSSSGESGCEKTTFALPTGTAEKKLNLTVKLGNGLMEIQAFNGVISNLVANSKGDINAEVPATQGGTVRLISSEGGDVTATVPSAFAADHVQVVGLADKINLTTFASELQGKTTCGSPDGTDCGGRGAAGTGLVLLKLESQEFAGDRGQVNLQGR